MDQPFSLLGRAETALLLPQKTLGNEGGMFVLEVVPGSAGERAAVVDPTVLVAAG
jgi:hypothetical protein